jgi:CheY-like chemotaxis protein
MNKSRLNDKMSKRILPRSVYSSLDDAIPSDLTHGMGNGAALFDDEPQQQENDDLKKALAPVDVMAEGVHLARRYPVHDDDENTITSSIFQEGVTESRDSIKIVDTISSGSRDMLKAGNIELSAPARPKTTSLDEEVSSSNGEDISLEESSLDREVRRLKVLRSYLGVWQGDHRNRFERLAALASRIFGTQMAMVTVVDLDKQYCISSRGADLASIRKSPFCSHSILDDSDILLVLDAARDDRFSCDPQVIGEPNIRFYAGAPLVCSEGYRLGTLCVMDSKPRRGQVSLEEKQSLVDLATVAMETLDDLREKQLVSFRDPTQQIACTAHDLLTPLTGIALSISLLKEDKGLESKLTDQQRDMIETASNCSTVMNNICNKTMDIFRDQGRAKSQNQAYNSKSKKGSKIVQVSSLVKNLNTVMEPFPKQVPIIIQVDPHVPLEFIGDEMKIFRSATNYLTNACAKTDTGFIRFKVFIRPSDDFFDEEIVFECEDTGPGVDSVKYPYLFKDEKDYPEQLLVLSEGSNFKKNAPGSFKARVKSAGLGLQSVATQISSLGGRYGYHPRSALTKNQDEADTSTSNSGSLFWFSIPMIVPEEVSSVVDPQQVNNLSLFHLPMATPSPSDSIKQLKDTTEIFHGVKKPSMNVLVPELSKRAMPTTVSIDDEKNGSKTSQYESCDHKRKASAHEDKIDTLVRRNCDIATKAAYRALVIEDSVVVRKILVRVLVKLGFEVTEAVNGMEGLKELKDSLFHLVLCDFLMPVMDGMDCVQQYRRWEALSRPDFRQYIVGISAHASEKDTEQGLKIGMDEFRSKPVSFKDLADLKNSERFQQISERLEAIPGTLEPAKRQRVDLKMEHAMTTLLNNRACLVIEANDCLSALAEAASFSIGWNVVSTNNQVNAMHLLQKRNWDAIFVDDDSGYNHCVTLFREWETTHRVNRQKNIILISSNFVSPQSGLNSFQVPTGFDGALGKPVKVSDLQMFFEKASTGCAIVLR